MNEKGRNLERKEEAKNWLEDVMDYGERIGHAHLSVSTQVSLLQEEMFNIAMRAGFSI